MRTLVDLAARARRAEVEALVNRVDELDLIDPETLRAALESLKESRAFPSSGRRSASPPSP